MQRNRTIVQFLLAVLVAGGTASANPPASPATWRLRPEAQVDGTGLFLDQILSTDETSAPAMHWRIGDSPSINQPSILSRDQVLALIRRALPDFSDTLGGVDRIRIVRKTRAFGEVELLELLTAALQQSHVRDRGELELRLARPWTPAQVPDEPFILKVTELPTLGVSPNFIARFELAGARERFAEWQAVLQARIWRDVLIARSTLKRGQSLVGADLAVERRDILTLREPLEAAAREDDSLEFVESVPLGSPLTARSVRTRPLLTRGRLVDAVLQDGALNITLKVEMLEDGQAGQTVRVRNPVSRRELSGKVINAHTIALPL